MGVAHSRMWRDLSRGRALLARKLGESRMAPSILLALFLWRDEIALTEDKKADLPGSGSAD